jgi:hypothetical protein
LRLPIAAACILVTNSCFAGAIPTYDFRKPLNDGMTLVGLECHKKNETLELGLFDASTPPIKRMDLWDTWDLVKIDPKIDQISAVRSVERSCVIRGARYLIRFTGLPGNFNIQGRCGAAVSAHAKVWKDGKLLFDQDFEQCGDEEGSGIRTVRFSRDSDQPLVETGR